MHSNKDATLWRFNGRLLTCHTKGEIHQFWLHQGAPATARQKKWLKKISRYFSVPRALHHLKRHKRLVCWMCLLSINHLCRLRSEGWLSWSSKSPQPFSWVVHIFFLCSISLCHPATLCVVFPLLVFLQSSLPKPSSSAFRWTLSECARKLKLSFYNLLHKIPVFSYHFQNLIIWHKSSPADLERSPVTPHLKCIYPSFCFLYQRPRLWSKNRKDMGFNALLLYCDIYVASQKFFILQESHYYVFLIHVGNVQSLIVDVPWFIYNYLWCVLPKSDGIGQTSELRNSQKRWVYIHIKSNYKDELGLL